MEDMRKRLAMLMDSRQWRERYFKMVKEALQDPEVQTFLKQHEADLANDAIDRGTAKIYEFVSEHNKIARGELPLAPGYQPKLVVANGLIDVAYEPTDAKVAADEEAKQASLVTSVNMPKDIRDASLDSYDPTDDRLDALLAANRFVLAVVADPKAFHQGLYLSGPFGVGKTYLLGAIANDLASKGGIATTLIHVPTFVVEMKNAIGNNSVLKKIDSVKRAPILMLDDIGAESISPWVRDDVLGIILQYRMQEKMPTLFSSNKSMAELTESLAGTDRGNSEMLKAKRIMERVRFLAKEITVDGENRRNPLAD